MATTFGRRSSEDGDLAARRAAFIAAERARAAEQRDEPVRPASRYAARGAAPAAGSKAPVYGEEKTLFVAYLNWFLLGFVGAHRFYLGHVTSGVVQAAMAGSVLLLIFFAMAEQSLGYAGLSIFISSTLGLWLLADLALIPGMCQRANAKLRRSETKRSFALD